MTDTPVCLTLEGAGQDEGTAAMELDGFLKAYGIYENVTLADTERDFTELKAALGSDR